MPAETSPPTVSILAPGPLPPPGRPDDHEVAALQDLQLDQLITRLLRQRGDRTDLAAQLRTRLADRATIDHRQAVFTDLERPELVEPIRRFTLSMHRVARTLEHHRSGRAPRGHAGWLVQAVRLYLDAVAGLGAALRAGEPTSSGLRAIRDAVTDLEASSELKALASETRELVDALSRVRYRLQLAGPWIEVGVDEDPRDHADQVAATFARFRRGPVAAPPQDRRRSPDNDHLDTLVLAELEQLFPDTFAALERFAAAHPEPRDPTLLAFATEVGFYLAYLDLIAPLRRAGLAFCMPELAEEGGGLEVEAGFDLVLADALLGRGEQPVTNDLRLSPDERILLVTGANQGGKTTFARMIGQLHHLAALGCPVPGRRVRLRHAPRILTHFARGERLDDRQGRLLDDLVRLRDLLAVAGPDDVVITNELFRSTTVADAEVLGHRVIATLRARGCLTLMVTFLDELVRTETAGSPHDTVSLVATVTDDGVGRTFRLERRPADGRAYAAAVAAVHRLTYEQVRERVAG